MVRKVDEKAGKKELRMVSQIADHLYVAIVRPAFVMEEF